MLADEAEFDEIRVNNNDQSQGNLYEYDLENDDNEEPYSAVASPEQKSFLCAPVQRMEISASDIEGNSETGKDSFVGSTSLDPTDTRRFCTYFIFVGLFVLLTYLTLSTMVPTHSSNLNGKHASSPSLAPSSASRESKRKFSASFLSNTPISFLNDLEGCWTKCFHSEFGKPLDPNFLHACQGPWLFFYTVDKYTDESIILAGGFARKSIIESPQVQNNSCTNYGAPCQLHGVLEGGVYWYRQSCKEYDYDSIGFSLDPIVQLDWNYHYVEVSRPDRSLCRGSLSWSLAGRPHAPSSVNCVPSEDKRYKQIVMTSNCHIEKENDN